MWGIVSDKEGDPCEQKVENRAGVLWYLIYQHWDYFNQVMVSDGDVKQ